jgi:hypothetical protein
VQPRVADCLIRGLSDLKQLRLLEFSQLTTPLTAASPNPATSPVSIMPPIPSRPRTKHVKRETSPVSKSRSSSESFGGVDRLGRGDRFKRMLLEGISHCERQIRAEELNLQRLDAGYILKNRELNAMNHAQLEKMFRQNIGQAERELVRNRVLLTEFYDSNGYRRSSFGTRPSDVLNAQLDEEDEQEWESLQADLGKRVADLKSSAVKRAREGDDRQKAVERKEARQNRLNPVVARQDGSNLSVIGVSGPSNRELTPE